MPAPLFLDMLRQRVIAAYQAKEESQRQLAKRFKVSLSFVTDLSQHYRETGMVEPRPHGGRAITKLEASRLPVVKALVEAQPDTLLEELLTRQLKRLQVERQN